MTDSKSACEKCDCPQSKHRAVKPRGTLQDRPDVESYCENCGAEDCWHFTGYTPPAPKPSTVEERCAYQLHDGTTCDASRESHVACGDKWCHAFVAPATPAAWPDVVLGSGASVYRKKPVTISATRITDEWFDGNHPNELHPVGLEMDPVLRCVWIPTLEGTMRGNVGDWIIRGVKGELYPCKHDIFTATYEAVTW